MEVKIVSVQKRPKFISVGDTPDWVWIEYELDGRANRLDFKDEGQTEAQLIALVKADAKRFAAVYQAKIEV